jgi:hypothetical protein
MERFGDMKGNSEPFNKFYMLHVCLRPGRKRHSIAERDDVM